MSPLKKITKLFSGRVIDVGIETHALPNGRIADYEIVRHPGGAAVLPILDDGRVLLIRQFRPVCEGMVLEIPAGRLEQGETPVQCAVREMVEETGFRASSMEPLGHFLSTLGFCDERIDLFVGTNLEMVERDLDPDEVIDLYPLSLDEALSKVRNGDILDSKTQLALFLYRDMVSEKKP